MDFGTEVVQVAGREPLREEFLEDGHVIGEGADGRERRTIARTAKTAGGGQQERGFDHVEVDAGRTRAIREHAELVIHRRDGQIRDSDSYGHDPFPPRDQKH